MILPAGVVARREALVAALQRHRQVSYFRISNIILLRPVLSTLSIIPVMGIRYAGSLSACDAQGRFFLAPVFRFPPAAKTDPTHPYL
jgi:hypothetical protein